MDLTFGTDLRGDYALFIDEKHFSEDQWSVDDEVAKKANQPTFFRVIRNGKQQGGHGWVERNEIIQWG